MAVPIKIVCISDTHGQHSRLQVPEGDILVHAGDFMHTGRRLAEIAEFDRWLGEQPHPFKVVIAGNHDVLFERAPGLAQSQLTNAIYLENSGTEVLGLKFWGSPVQPAFNNWAFNVERGAIIRRYWNMIPGDTDVLLTHGPPFGILDCIRPGEIHLGCEELSIVVKRIKPRLHIFGHIHGGHGEFRGKRDRQNTHFINAAVLNEAYHLVHSAQVVEIDTGTIAKINRQ